MLGLLAFFRIPSFVNPGIDNEVYFQVAQAMLHGHAPYTVVWDHKPIGVYVFFAAGMICAGGSMAGAMLMYALMILANSLLIKHLVDRVNPGLMTPGLVAVFLYIAMVGSETNTELLFAPFITLGALLLLQPIINGDQARRRLLPYLAGIAFGIAIQIKYVVALDVATIGIVCTGFGIAVRRHAFPSTMLSLCTMAIAASLVSVAVMVAYLAMHHFGDFVYANFTANQLYVRYFLHFNLHELVVTVVKLVLETLPAWLGSAAVLVWWHRAAQAQRPVLLLCLLWAASALFTVVFVMRGTFHHYFLQVVTPLAILGAHTASRVISAMDRHRGRQLAVLAGLVASMSTYGIWKIAVEMIRSSSDGHAGNRALLADAVRNHMRPGDRLYVCSADLYLYRLVDALPPGKYVLPFWLVDPRAVKFSGSDPAAEAATITGLHPKIVVMDAAYLNAPSTFLDGLNASLNAGYIEIARVNDRLVFADRAAVPTSQP